MKVFEIIEKSYKPLNFVLMKTKKYLERLLNNEAVLSGNVAQSAYCRVDFDVDAAVEFANAAALNMLIKLSKLAKLFETHYAETVSQRKTGLIQLFRRGRLDRERRFWEIFGTEVAKIRTRRMLEAMTRDGKLHVRRNNLDFNAEAAKAYYLSLDEEKRLLLLGNVGRKADNSFRLFQENLEKEEISSGDIENYKNSALFWGEVWDFLSSIKIAA